LYKFRNIIPQLISNKMALALPDFDSPLSSPVLVKNNIIPFSLNTPNDNLEIATNGTGRITPDRELILDPTLEVHRINMQGILRNKHMSDERFKRGKALRRAIKQDALASNLFDFFGPNDFEGEDFDYGRLEG
jgi:hypothetical protein